MPHFSIGNDSAGPLLRWLKRCWRKLPRSVRHAALEFLQFARRAARLARLRVLVGRAKARKYSAQTGSLCIAGFLRLSNGLGEGMRLQVDLVRKIGIEPRLIDLTHVVSGLQPNLETPDVHETAVGDSNAIILHINPPELEAALLSAEVRRRTYRIGCWVWETDTAPPSWRGATELVHEIWAPTEFCAAAFRQLSSTPVHVLPYPLAPLANAVPNRSKYGMSEQDFVVLFAYDVLSSHKRKNPEAVVQAFLAAFPREKDVTLVLKIRNTSLYPFALESIVAAARGDRRVKIVIEDLSAREMAGLIRAADVVLSLHRSEGFGLLPAQAMMEGKLVIATGWSGNCAFMNSENSLLVPYTLDPVTDPQGLYRDGIWARPDADVAAGLLRWSYDNPAQRRQIGKRAAKFMNTKFGDQLADAYRQRLSLLNLTVARGEK